MGNSTAKQDTTIVSNPNREIFITFKHIITSTNSAFSRYVVFVYIVRYQRYIWEIEIRFSSIDSLNTVLTAKYGSEMVSIQRPERYRLQTKTDKILAERALSICKFLQELCDNKLLFQHPGLRELLSLNACSLNPNMGRKGREGWLQKSSGGYLEKFSRKFGDFFDVWQYRWIVLHDTFIAWYKTPQHKEALGSLQIDANLLVTNRGRIISITTQTRKLLLYADTPRNAMNWVTDLRLFYNQSRKMKIQHFEARFAPRRQCDVKVYTLTTEYYSTLAITLLSAQREILITGWKNSPTVILSRPPYPTLRLDQILKYKAEQGIKIHMLLYKEVEGIGQTNDSSGAKLYLESLHPNIKVIRHPNKFVGGSTAMLWSHHEKVAVIDRSVCFVGGVDISFTRWDNELKSLADEDGVIYPGHDYKNPAPGLFKPLRVEPADASLVDSDDELIEVEVAVTAAGDTGVGSVQQNANALIDDEPAEVDVLFDFGLNRSTSTRMLTSTFLSNLSLSSSPAAALALANSKSTLNRADTVDSSGCIFDNAPSYTSSNSNQQPIVYPQKDINVGSNSIIQQQQQDEEEQAYAFERNQPETEEEKQMKLDAMKELQGYNTREEEESELFSSKSKTSELSITSGITVNTATNTIMSSTTQKIFDSISTVIKTASNGVSGTKIATKRANALEPRDLHPRMPWHDIQCSVSGLVARDVASHFVQRWNHHRLSASQHQNIPMFDITDEPDFGICARCETPNLSETIATCPKCGYDLGVTNTYILCTHYYTIDLSYSPVNY